MIKINLAFYWFKPSEKLEGKKTTNNRKYIEKKIYKMKIFKHLNLAIENLFCLFFLYVISAWKTRKGRSNLLSAAVVIGLMMSSNYVIENSAVANQSREKLHFF